MFVAAYAVPNADSARRVDDGSRQPTVLTDHRPPTLSFYRDHSWRTGTLGRMRGGSHGLWWTLLKQIVPMLPRWKTFLQVSSVSYAPNAQDRSCRPSLLLAFFALQAGRRTEEATASLGGRTISLSGSTLQQLARLMGGTSGGRRLTRLELNDEEEDMDVDEDEYTDDEEISYKGPQWFPPAKEPRKEGLEPLASGDFGNVAVKRHTPVLSRNIARRILDRRSCAIPVHSKEDLHSVSRHIIVLNCF